MVVNVLAAFALSLVPLAVHAQPTEPSLVEGWQTTLEQQAAPIPWSHAFALRHDQKAHLPQPRQRLIQELGTLRISARLSGQPALATGLAHWQSALGEFKDEQARTPGRFDLPWLGAHLRQVPPLSAIAYWGFCQVPDWVEVWSLDGVSRVPWTPDLRLADVYRELSSTARRADHAALIVPSGNVLRRGVASWNRQPTPLAPGSRVFFELPGRQGLSGALPFPGTATERSLVNRLLPTLLSTRLPGDDCPLWQAN
ncbi:hypothetical protein GPM19_09720 [Halomonas sp. ZH2S]|uniref:Capsule biosynthesis GfcC-like C-terminal domain-containing protein n=1 Tax=Vreelandella zhuhanensis TaxID=2684210 RepID=A0A7X3H2T1_9GAMM|nr:capsule biosynthesis GfcC family protein [Halomonas zhuhanensis]MWJ28480.1 hypothetical protein [Halomonas zhuhanensis]